MISVEAVDAIQQALERDGMLQKIRAQLRTSVYQILSQKDGPVKSSKKSFPKNDVNHSLAAELVRGYLADLNMKETLMSFDSEFDGVCNVSHHTIF